MVAPLFELPKTWAAAIFSFIVLQIISSNIRKLAQNKGWDNALVHLLPFITPDWETFRARWWLSILVGLLGGGAAILALGPPPPSPEAIAQATAPLQAERDKLLAQLHSQTLELSQISGERDLARQQLSGKENDSTKNNVPKSLSQDDVQFRNDLRKFIRVTLLEQYDSFYGLANTMSGGQDGGPIVPESKKSSADAAYRLLRGATTTEYTRAWTKLYEATNTTLDTMDTINLIKLLQAYFDSYGAFANGFHDFLIIAGPSDDRFNLLPKVIDIDNRVQQEFEGLKSYPNSGIANFAFPAHLADGIRPFVRQ